MTLQVVLDFCEEQQVDIFSTVVKISKFSSLIGGTSANFKEGDSVRLVDLIFGLMLPSGNDASLALANFFGYFLSKYDHKLNK